MNTKQRAAINVMIGRIGILMAELQAAEHLDTEAERRELANARVHLSNALWMRTRYAYKRPGQQEEPTK